MDGFYIEGKPLTSEMAEEIDSLLQTLTISAKSAEAYLTIRASLTRLISGRDVCVKTEEEKN